jgi:L-fuconolactonase
LPHVACKLSGLVTEADWLRGLRQKDYDNIALCLDAALEAFGPQRLMFGSDWPVCLLAASYAKVAAWCVSGRRRGCRHRAGAAVGRRRRAATV